MTQPDVHPSDEVLNEYLDGELDGAARARIESHLAACTDCAGRLQDLRELFSALAEAPQESLSRDLVSPVLSAIRGRSAQRRVRWALALAAALEVLIAAAALALMPPSAAWQTPFTQAAGALRQALTNGWLPAETALASFSRALLSAQSALSGGIDLFNAPLHLSLPPGLELGLILGAGALLWLAGNSLLLNVHKTTARGGMHG